MAMLRQRIGRTDPPLSGHLHAPVGMLTGENMCMLSALRLRSGQTAPGTRVAKAAYQGQGHFVRLLGAADKGAAGAASAGDVWRAPLRVSS